MLASDLPALDIAAFSLFAVCWLSYALLANHVVTRRPSLLSTMRIFRTRWIERMSERDLHVSDATLMSNLLRGALFFASTTVFILGGVVALLGTAPKVAEVIAQLPYASATSQRLAEMKAMILIIVYVYAFFKFTWSAWLYNVMAIMVGSMPPKSATDAQAQHHRAAAASVVLLAGEAYNNGMRAYYFSIPLMAWIIDPWLFMITTLIVTIVLYRREFHSPLVAALRDVEADNANRR